MAVRISSSESGCDSSCVRRYALSTSSRVIACPSTTAHVSADTGAGGADADLARHAVIETRGGEYDACGDPQARERAVELNLQ